MKVKQLIALLEDLDPDFNVVGFNADSFEMEDVTGCTTDDFSGVVYIETDDMQS